MQSLVFVLIFVLVLQIVLNCDEEFSAKSLDTAKGARQICRNHIRGGMDIVIVQNSNVSLEIGIEHRQLVDGNVENGGLLHDGVFVVTERLTGHHHVIHGGTQFAADGIGGLLPLSTGSGHQETPAAKCFGVRTDNAIRARDQD